MAKTAQESSWTTDGQTNQIADHQLSLKTVSSCAPSPDFNSTGYVFVHVDVVDDHYTDQMSLAYAAFSRVLPSVANVSYLW